MFIDAYQSILRDFGNAYGLDDLQADEDGFCCLALDEVVFNLQYVSDRQEVAAFSQIGIVDDDDPSMLFARMLENNLPWEESGGVLSLEPETAAVYLSASLPAQDLTKERFESMLEAFANTAEAWADRIANYSSESEMSTIGAAESDEDTRGLMA